MGAPRAAASLVLAACRTTPRHAALTAFVFLSRSRFHQEDDVSITPAGGFTVPRSTIAELKELSRPYGVLPYGTTRNEAEARLKQLRSQNGMPGV